jgi:hypothetical protein
VNSTPSEIFTYWGVPLEYCRAGYNDAGLNERAVEIPIARWFIGRQGAGASGLEVGNVLSHYGPVDWPVLDRYEAGATYNRDVFDFYEPVDWIVTVSTLEHIRWNEPLEAPHPDGSLDALAHLLGLLIPGGRMLVTIPMGWQAFLDSAILEHRLPVEPERQCTFVRASDQEHWVQTAEIEHRPYAVTSIWAEAVWVAEFSV